MCDDFTAHADDDALSARGIDRRTFAVSGAAAAMLAAWSGQAGAQTARRLTERTVTFETADGRADAFFVHPARGKHPAVIMWPDIGGLREAYKAMARRLAAAGFAVLAVNQYYRSARAPVLTSFAEWRTPPGQAKLAPMIAALTGDAVTRDATAFVAWLDEQRAVNTERKIGTCGYCMGGPFTVRTAAAVHARVGAAASFHGSRLVTDQPDSPHNFLALTQASYLIAIARNDDARTPGDKDTLRAAALEGGRPAEIEVYAADHGWCTLDSPVYDKAEADRAWGRMLELFKGL